MKPVRKLIGEPKPPGLTYSQHIAMTSMRGHKNGDGIDSSSSDVNSDTEYLNESGELFQY